MNLYARFVACKILEYTEMFSIVNLQFGEIIATSGCGEATVIGEVDYSLNHGQR